MQQPLPVRSADIAGGPDDDAIEFENDFDDVRHHDLDEHSWVEVIPQWVRAPDTLFAHLRDNLTWSQRQRWIYDRKLDEPRLTADYQDIRTAPTPTLRTLARRLSDVYDRPYDGVWVNLYRDQRDSTGWHGDLITCKRQICTVPVLTLGAARRFLIKSRAGGPSTRFVPQSGDLIVMRGRCQNDWVHAVPKQKPVAGPRISVNFQSSCQMTPDPPHRSASKPRRPVPGERT
jgi:alkylated DNA repair dioxygenase AlkB